MDPRKWNAEEGWTGLIGFGKGQTAGACKYGKEFSGFIKYGEFFEQLGTSQVLKKGYEQVASTVTAAFFTIFNVLQLQLRIYTVKTFNGNATCLYLQLDVRAMILQQN